MPSTLWNENSQLRRVFGWTDILRQWDESLNMPAYVQTVVNNLRAVSNPNTSRDYPLEHFTNFLNDEQDGLKWLLYEIITMRWMWGETRLDYLRRLVDLIEDLDSFFPNFVGSPRQTQTIREFVESNLNDDEQEFVNLMPRLEAPVTRVDVTNFAPITLRFLRDGRLSSSRNDDIIRIHKTTAGYNWVYHDQYGDEKSYTRDLTQRQVMYRLSNALRLLTVDEDPFLSVQLLVPNAPSVLVGVKSLNSSTRDLFYDTVEAAMEEWPTSR
jgi:hypothetical protein